MSEQIRGCSAYRGACKQSCSKRGKLALARIDDAALGNIREEFQEVGRPSQTAVDRKHASGIEQRAERIEGFYGAKRHALEHGLHEIAAPGGGVHANPKPGCAPVPVRAPKPGERGHERQTAGDRGWAGELLKLGEIGQQADPLQPLDRRAGCIDTAVCGVDSATRAFPPDRGQYSVWKFRPPMPGYHQRKRARAEGDLCVALASAAMAIERRHLVNDGSKYRHRSPVYRHLAERVLSFLDLRQQLNLHAEDVAKLRIPFA